MEMSKGAILGSVLLLSAACGGAPDPPTAPTGTTPAPPNISEQLTEPERATIASILGSSAVDACSYSSCAVGGGWAVDGADGSTT